MEASLQTGSLSGCESIADPSTEEECRSTVEHNLEVLETTQERAENLPQNSQETLSACASLSGALQQRCQDEASFALAFEQKNLSYCNRISRPEERDRCLSEQGDKIDQFYLRKAMGTANPYDCGPIANAQLKSLCLSSL